MQGNSEQVTAGDHVTLRKPHPCGTNDWLVVRVGSAVVLQCCGCSHKVELSAPEFARRLARVDKPQ